MTTTLRPDEPERHGAGGARSRRYTVCVNSRPVGRIELAAEQWFGVEIGRIAALEIQEADRRRGRATVAALAAEEVLRGWGCGEVQLDVPADAVIALRLAGTLGYTERNRNMVKRLSGPAPELPDGSSVRPLADSEFPAWEEHKLVTYLEDLVTRGIPFAQASAKAEADHRAVLPEGPRTAGTSLLTLAHQGQDVGTVWVRLRHDTDPQAPAWVFSVEVDEAYRGRGHGRTLMLVAERECLEAGVHRLGLNVFGGNTPALALYGTLGYATTRQYLFKRLL
ncbi:GNAT family N-acetyltransferase [Streptomyces sp. H10-C2]|uniref:GNAT family N-acetyltransferase n=1 Tax=unclassified Streptomyces TaxID=2593676 RepID=UPI0024B94687|nr:MULTISPECIES: GNAT family N-acetyltransferase [unclassified Streptomyces]MDJ0346334.1 GNAT family N-acetyltransferase [Streptomyces sp. PH10-H1]MDJ0370771.1 GNAT family N-acetyltransferase [Streptomyces sp. H10-C2]